MAEKVTIMVLLLKIDLQCRCCYKKVKKLLCKFSEIRDQSYNEKQNTVTITVVCCNPEKIRDKLYCKGAKLIQSIDLPKPKPEPKPEPAKPKPEPAKPKPDPEKPPKEVIVVVVDLPKPKPESKTPPKNPPPVLGYPPPVYGYPSRECCDSCSEGRSGGPCYHGYGRSPLCFEGYGSPPPPPPPCYGRPIYDSYGRGGPCYMARCDYYTCEENPSGCSTM